MLDYFIVRLLLFGGIVVVAIALPFLILKLMVVLFDRKVPDGDRPFDLVCPKCRQNVIELPPNWINNFPGYECRACRLHLRAPGTKGFYVFLLVLSGGFVGVIVQAIWESAGLDSQQILDHVGNGKYYLLFLFVAGYSIYKLCCPSPVIQYRSVDIFGRMDAD